ncbi:VanZ family protein [Pseudoduganella sp. OTU4001]|uniref:VanZ family protein n=1 Tax=Pseudoduganella sp. OTU4001 TaxID=3043854 RepID=UPI00313CC6C0
MQKFLTLLFLSDAHARLRFWGAITLFTLNCIIGSIPGAREEAAQYASGLVLHSFGYTVMTFLLFTGCQGVPAQRALKAVCGVAIMGAIDELVQSFFPYRHGSVDDWLVDMSAAVIAATVMWALWSLRKRPAA